MKKLHFALSCLFLSTVCSCSDTVPDYTEADKQEIKATVARVQKTDSLGHYIEKYTQEENHYGLCLAYNALGRNYRNKAAYAEALEAHNKALEYAALAVDTPEIVQAYNNLGTDYRRLGELKEASLHHYKALEYCEKYSDKSTYGAVKNRVVSLNGIGNIHLSMGDMKVAERAFRQALAGETQLGSDLGQAINYANLGAIFEHYEQYDSAKVYYAHSMACNQKANSTLGISLCHDHFGRLYEIAEQYDSALVEYGKAYTLMQGNNDSWHALKAAIAIARVYMQQGERAKAYPYLQEAVAMADATNSYGRMAEACRMLAAYEEQCGNHKALAHYKRSVAYNDSVYNAENQQQLRDSYVDYEKGQSLQQVETMRTAYEEEVKAKRMILAMAIAVAVSAALAIALLWYVLRTRRKTLQMLQRMERMRTTFFTNITHEFRTPLTVILGLGEQLQKEQGMDSLQRQYLESILRQGKSLLELVNQLLDITRLAAGAAEAQWCQGDIVAYVRRTVAGYVDYAGMRKVNLTFHSDKKKIEMCFVPEYIDKVMRNLLSNALKYTPEEGYIAIVLTTEGHSLKVHVTDTGRGFLAEDLPHVFELFYQGSNNGTDIVGTGVGLPFVRQMMEQMNGSVVARNRKEGGAELVLTLPLRQSAEITRQSTPWEEANVKEAESADPIEEPTTPGTPEKERSMVLVVEDNDDIVQYITALLKSRYDVRTAANGYEALLIAEELHPNLIITDLMMPEMDGYELCNRVRNSELLCHIPIVVVTARGEDDDRIRAIEDGADAYMQKPFNAEELLVRVENLISQRKMLQERFAQMLTKGVDAGWDLKDEDRKYLTRANGIIQDNMGDPDFGVEVLAEKMHSSTSKLYRRIRALTGYSSQAYILRLRMERAKELLSTTNHAVGDIAMRCGFEDTSYFTRTFRNFYGCTPSQMRKR